MEISRGEIIEKLEEIETVLEKNSAESSSDISEGRNPIENESAANGKY